ncbi:HNH endonuclease [Halorubrum sp. AS12]|uniref:HNH endonuclease n=1 Tax=Halorubrum sp. AS12 TaxID=3409687 RepID=UPI003DA760B6
MYHEEGLNQEEIAERFGTAQRTVSRQMEFHDVERRDYSESLRVERAGFYTNQDGYEQSIAHADNRPYRISIHRLVAVAEYGIDQVKGKHVHHKNSIPWDNRHENLEPLTPSEHSKRHLSDDYIRRDEEGRLTNTQLLDEWRTWERGER